MVDLTAVEQLLNQGKLFLLLDGLNEVREAESKRVLQEIQNFTNLFPQNQFFLRLFYTIGTALKGRISKMLTLNVSQSQPSANLKVTILLENLATGQVAASIFELPDCRVEAPNREEAITQIKAAFLEGLKRIETISWDVPVQASEPAWIKFAGVFKDDLDFQEIMQTIRDERNSNDESEVDPSYYL
ncbi:hypothetical protein [Scytonema hofmannii]|nr:hypothetical protein [Scytonema hofmannii]